MTDVIEPTPMLPHVRALCWGGPCDGEVLLAPRLVPSSFTRPLLLVRHGPDTDGGYVLLRATRHEQVIGMQMVEVTGDPRDWPMAWRWYDAPALDVLLFGYDVVELRERMTRLLWLCDWQVNDGKPYRPSERVQAMCDDLDVYPVTHDDGRVSFHDAADRLARQLLDELDRDILGDDFRIDYD